MKNRQGTLTVYCGSMFSGKSSALVEDCKRFKIAGFSVGVFKPQIDDRFHESMVFTHDGDFIEARAVQEARDIMQKCNDLDVIGIDEVQFFDAGIFNVVQWLLGQGKTVVCSGLDIDFRGNPFPVTAHLAMVANKVEKKQGVCVHCGADGYLSHRKTDAQEVVVVGGADKYECICHECWNEFKSRGNV